MMRSALFLCLLSISLATRAQKITYDPPPNLPQQIGQADYKLIVDSSVKIVGARYKIDSVSGGSIHVLADNNQEATINLDNLILECLGVADRSTWPGMIRHHFENLFATIDQQRHLDPTNYETMKKYLSIRIYPQETVQARGGTDSLVFRTDLDGTYTLLMIDFPGAFTPVPRAMFDHWHKDATEVFQVAQANIDSAKVEKVTKTFDVGGVSVEVEMLGEENYAASYALDLQHNSPELLGEWGCALAMPNKGLVSICKIGRDKPVDFVKFIQLTQPFIEKSYQEHAQPISDQYFWYYQGKFTHIETKVDDNGHLQVLAPAGLAELMTVQKP
jgi:hypothetical protein